MPVTLVQQLGQGLTLAFLSNPPEPCSWLPVDRFCIRKPAAVFVRGTYWVYADIVPWDNPHWPLTYDTSIHAFSSPDCRTWHYHGEVIGHREPGAWDYGGVATPGAVYTDDRVHVFYSGRTNLDGSGPRHIGMATAAEPGGPFVKATEPVFRSTHPRCHLDDLAPVPSADGKGIDLYFRQAEHHRPPPNYSIRLTCSRDGGRTWSEPVTVLAADEVVRAYETTEARRIGDTVLLACFEHFTSGRFRTGLFTSRDGRTFVPAPDRDLGKGVCRGWSIPRCGLQIALIPGPGGVVRHLGVARTTDEHGHYNLAIYPIRPLGRGPK